MLLSFFVDLAIYIGVIWLQNFLSKKQNRFLGLILPGFVFLCSLMALLGLTANTNLLSAVAGFGGQKMFSVLTVACFAFINVATGILMAIYFACRHTVEKKEELVKMVFQDLA